MNPRDFLDVAGEWATGAREAEWRSALSRAYYAAFHVAGALLEASGFAVPQVEGAHAYLWLRLSNAGHPDVQQAGSNLRALRGLRNWADYDLSRPFPQALAIKEVAQTVVIIALLDDLRNTPIVLARVIDAIRVYERDVLREVTFRS
jgi:uncharacterized protein (UPF0332 family)